ncbi:hypothetical protein D9619_009999 [Psilocybe cf. subviscida]|uniref:BZIP domain-containing protein n=1 Tax=Psilocybe cf. subviscida TaxID=2480587 RepID=A0A8H5BLX2_9AGAR|nr:hypothetical protein D9619_009999 [Psilocybe cf. subviscida]
MSSVTSNNTAGSERPERSRNAKAQARHRAKRKAYIDQLEQTVTKLQIAVGFSTDQIAALPPPLLKIRELEQDNARLQRENDDLRRLLDPNSVPASRPESTRRMSIGPYGDSHSRSLCDPRDYGLKRRRFQDGVYMSPGNTPPHDSNSRPPPPLTIPQSMSHGYGSGMGSSSSHSHSQSHSTSHNHGGGPIFGSLPGGVPPFQMPNTPSGSSATSSPPFSASFFPLHLQT